MNKDTELYERAALCHERALNSSKEAEQARWLELASIWLILADSACAKRAQPTIAEEEPIELGIEEMISLTPTNEGWRLETAPVGS